MSESLADFERRQHEINDLRDANMRLATQLRDAKHKVDRLVEATHQGSYDAMLAVGPLSPVVPPKSDRRKNAEVALWDLGDWQGGKLTTSYNSEVMRRRVMLYCEKARKITDIQRADHPVKQCVILFGGDMIEGVQIFPQQPFEIDSTIFAQYVNVARLMVDVVAFALSVYESVLVVPEWGNHGRMGSKRSVIPNSDNLDRMTFELSRQLLSKEQRLTWQDCPEDIQRLEIGNYRALVMHGDEVGRGGFASRNTIVSHVNRWRSGAYQLDGEPWPFVDCYIHHFHIHAEDPMANGTGSVFWTGSVESDNRYARDNLASAGLPSQRLHFVDPARGRVTCQYKVVLDGKNV